MRRCFKIHNNREMEIRNNNKGTPMKIICYRSWDDIDVEFLDEFMYVKEHTTYSNFKKGEVKNPYDRSVFNIGYVGVGKYMTRNTILKKPETSYETWTSMLERCYKNKKSFPAYYGICTVCDEWLNFQNFAEWFENNKYKVDERLHIDKDILFPGNKIYSPDMCLLVPQRINMLFLHKPNNSGLPNGINKTKTNKYNASYCGKSLGTFSTLEEAYSIYAQNKENAIKKTADEYKDIIPQKVFDALYKYKVEIVNDRNFCA